MRGIEVQGNTLPPAIQVKPRKYGIVRMLHAITM